MARPRTVRSSKSGTAPGRWSRERTLTWTTRATTTSAEESRIRLTRMGIQLLQLRGRAVGGRVRRGGDRDGDRRRRRRLGLLRQHRVARVLLRGLDDDADDVELGEADVRRDVDGAGQAALRGLDAGDH